MAALQRSGTVAALGTAQTLAWAGPHLLLGLPLNWCLPALDKPAAVPAGAGSHHAAGLLALATLMLMHEGRRAATL